METVHDRMSSRAVVKDTVYAGRRDTVVRHQADTIYVQGRYVMQEQVRQNREGEITRLSGGAWPRWAGLPEQGFGNHRLYVRKSKVENLAERSE